MKKDEVVKYIFSCICLGIFVSCMFFDRNASVGQQSGSIVTCNFRSVDTILQDVFNIITMEEKKIEYNRARYEDSLKVEVKSSMDFQPIFARVKSSTFKFNYCPDCPRQYEVTIPKQGQSAISIVFSTNSLEKLCELQVPINEAYPFIKITYYQPMDLMQIYLYAFDERDY